MNAQPKLYPDGSLRTIPGPDGALWVECEVIAPASMVGRSVDVHFPAEAITPLLRAARSAAITARQRHEGSTDHA